MPPIPLEEKGNGPVGIIYPPPEVRNIVDKTASFVARNGPEFEQRIKQNEVNNPKFNFLSPGDPYHAYYQQKVKEIREGKEEEKEKSAPKPPKPGVPSAPSATSEAVKQKQSELLKQAQKEQEPPPPTEPPPDFEFTADPPSISAYDLDVVKLTAQFVARNGRQFLTSLMQKEQRNFQFDFLRPQHALFQYFTKLLEQYTKVLIPPKDLMKKLQIEADDEKKIKDEINYRVRWVKHQEAQKRREAEQVERERVAYAQIDWHSFVVVETVDYQPWEVGNFPPPTNPTEVGARVLMQRRVEQLPPGEIQKVTQDGATGEANTNVEDMEEDSSSDEEEEEEEAGKEGQASQGTSKPLAQVDAAPAVNQPPPSLPTPGNVEVRKYDPKQAKQTKKVDTSSEEFLVSPITGERVPASKVQEHMRIGLLDPRWVEERDKQITAKASEELVYAPGQAIESSLKHLAERRTDIFGVGEEAVQEKAIGKKMGDDAESNPSRDAAAWDGHSSTVEAAARAARANISINEQIEQIHRAKGLIPSEKESIGPQATVETSQTISRAINAPGVSTTTPTISAQPNLQPITVMNPNPILVTPAPPPPAPAPAPQPQFFVGSTGFPQPPAMPTQMPGLAPQMLPQQQQPPQQAPSTLEEGEPANKRPRGEDHLIAEADFLAHNPNPVHFQVICPAAQPDKPEWRLRGQIIQLTMDLREQVSTIKARLHEETGMPPGKQKLQMESLFLKDANSLAYYNFRQGSTLTLQIKERGGRKK